MIPEALLPLPRLAVGNVVVDFFEVGSRRAVDVENPARFQYIPNVANSLNVWQKGSRLLNGLKRAVKSQLAVARKVKRIKQLRLSPPAIFP